jgi:vesicle coat complex subunit
MTKLFQSKDVMLRRMIYLCIKEMATIANDVIIVTSSLTKDMTGKEDLYRGPAIRALCRITDVFCFSYYYFSSLILFYLCSRTQCYKVLKDT